MEISVASIAVSILIAVVLAVAWKGVNLVWLRPKRAEKILRQQGLSGNPYRLLIGDFIEMHQMRTSARSTPMDFSNDISSRVEPFLHHNVRNHGKNSFAWLGPIPAVILDEPGLIREVLSRMDDFPKPNLKNITLAAPGLGSYEGDKWAKHRKLISPAFHMEKLELMLPAFKTSCSDMISRWEEMVSQTGSAEFDVHRHFARLTADVISRAAFGSSYDQGRKAFELIEEQIELLINNFIMFIVPGLSCLPTSMFKRFKKLQKGINDTIESVIDQRRNKMEAGEEARGDLLGMLMENSAQVQQNGNKKQHFEITKKELIDECKFLYAAGQETTSVLLSYTIIMLSKYKDWQMRARAEVLKVFSQNTPDLNGLNHLKIVTMILYEVLRLYPSVPTTARIAKNDINVGNLFLPAGTFVYLPIIFVHQDPKYWGEDAAEFKPERFSEGISQASNDAAFFPFGWGPRICVGQKFALLEAKMAIATILQRFSFELSPSYVHAPSPLITLHPQFGAHVILHKL